MNELGITEKDRLVAIEAAKKREKSGNLPATAISLGTKKIVVGRKTGILSPISSTILNALKVVSKIPDEVDLIAPAVLEPILEIKNKTSNFKESYLKLGEVLIALSICSTTNPVAKKVLENLDKLRDTELHATHMIADDELVVLSNLGINATCGTEIDIN